MATGHAPPPQPLLPILSHSIGCNYARVDSRCPRTGLIIHEYEREDCLSQDCKDSWFYQPRQSTSHPSRFHEHINETPSLGFLDLPGPSSSILVGPPTPRTPEPPPQRRPRKLQKRARRRPVPEPEPQDPAEGISQESLDSQARTVVPDEEAVRDKGKATDDANNGANDGANDEANDEATAKDDQGDDGDKEESPIKAALKLPKMGIEVMAGLVTGLISKIHIPRPRLPPLIPKMPSMETLREVGVAVSNWTGVGYLWRGLSGLAKREPLRPFSIFSNPFKFKRS